MQISRTLDRVPNSVYLWMAIIIFAASNSVTRKIIQIGQDHIVNGRNPISLCNVLFVGNICAFLVLGLIFYRDWMPRKLQQLTYANWISLTLIALLSGALAPALMFTALDKTTVTSVVLISNLQPPLTLALSIWLLGTRVNIWTIAGSIVAFMGVAVTILLANPNQSVSMMGIHLGTGELLAVAGALISSIATIILQMRLRGIPVGIVCVYQTLVGTVVFFVLANILFGWEHFAEVSSPFLWGWMLIYATIIVVIGQLCGIRGFMGSSPALIALANSFNPVAAIIFAYLILGEVPKSSQYLGGSIILVGIILGLKGSLQPKSTPVQSVMLMGNGFKGV